MTAVIYKISVAAVGKHTLSPEESPHRSVSRANMRAITAAKTSVNCCNRIVRTQRQRLQKAN